MRSLSDGRLIIDIGEWLLDSRLVGKQLDVRVVGTSRMLFHNGRYEKQCGFFKLKEVLTKVENSITVRIGFAQSRVKIPPRYLQPLLMTERPGFVSAELAEPIVKAMGQRVVIIGADVQGNREWIGEYGFILGSEYILPPTMASVQVIKAGAQCFAYFDASSLCRSTVQDHW